MKIKILYLDDEEYNRKSFYAHFRSKYEIHLCSSEEDVIETLNNVKKVDIVILNRFIPDLAGFEFLHKIKLSYDPLRIIITDQTESLPLLKARRTGNIFDFQKDSWLAEDMEDIIQRAVNYMNWKNKSNKLESNL